MADCQFGSEPKPDAPEWFVFELVDFVAILGSLGGRRPQLGSFITLTLLDLPATPQRTADF